MDLREHHKLWAEHDVDLTAIKFKPNVVNGILYLDDTCCKQLGGRPAVPTLADIVDTCEHVDKYSMQDLVTGGQARLLERMLGFIEFLERDSDEIAREPEYLPMHIKELEMELDNLELYRDECPPLRWWCADLIEDLEARTLELKVWAEEHHDEIFATLYSAPEHLEFLREHQNEQRFLATLASHWDDETDPDDNRTLELLYPEPAMVLSAVEAAVLREHKWVIDLTNITPDDQAFVEDALALLKGQSGRTVRQALSVAKNL